MRVARALTWYVVYIVFAGLIEAPPQAAVTYVVPSVQTLYPDQSWLPEPYKSYYKDLVATIQHFTEQSLNRDDIRYTSVTATLDGVVTVESTDPRVQHYAIMHPAFFNTSLRALHGIALCKRTPGCWYLDQKHPEQPWAFFLPVGLSLVNQKAILFLDFPPAVSLIKGDYLNNYTTDRWSRVLQAVGISNPVLYETIVDSHPIAAASDQVDYMPDPTRYFNTQDSDHFYLTPMVTLLTNPPTHASPTRSLPVAVLGSPARAAWGDMVQNQGPVDILQVGTFTLPGAAKETCWVAANHPLVTAYQCCPGDPYTKCDSYKLVQDEQIDLQAACIIRTLAENQALDPAAVKQQCHQQWGLEPSRLPPTNAHVLCMQAKMDNQNPTAQCAQAQEADAYCTHYRNNPCATFTCEVP